MSRRGENVGITAYGMVIDRKCREFQYFSAVAIGLFVGTFVFLWTEPFSQSEMCEGGKGLLELGLQRKGLAHEGPVELYYKDCQHIIEWGRQRGTCDIAWWQEHWPPSWETWVQCCQRCRTFVAGQTWHLAHGNLHSTSKSASALCPFLLC